MAQSKGIRRLESIVLPPAEASAERIGAMLRKEEAFNKLYINGRFVSPVAGETMDAVGAFPGEGLGAPQARRY